MTPVILWMWRSTHVRRFRNAFRIPAILSANHHNLEANHHPRWQNIISKPLFISLCNYYLFPFILFYFYYFLKLSNFFYCFYFYYCYFIYLIFTFIFNFWLFCFIDWLLQLFWALHIPCRPPLFSLPATTSFPPWFQLQFTMIWISNSHLNHLITSSLSFFSTGRGFPSFLLLPSFPSSFPLCTLLFPSLHHRHHHHFLTPSPTPPSRTQQLWFLSTPISSFLYTQSSPSVSSTPQLPPSPVALSL